MMKPTCDHTEGCETDATYFGYDGGGNLIATFCARHFEGHADDEGGVQEWLGDEEVADKVRTLSFLIGLAQSAAR